MRASTDPTTELLKIGELSDRFGVPVKTIRYYERLGLIRAAKRTSGGFRLFAPETSNRLAFIKRSQSLGLSLQEIGELLAIHDRGEMPCGEVKHKLEEKIAHIQRRVEELQKLETQLRSLLADADVLPTRHPDGTICPIIQQERVTNDR